ncbi:MAG: hypothetical protein O2954_20240, partial [bacterium]|nr:hypothetical protein [bacterium]
MEAVSSENPTFPIRLFGRSLDMWQGFFYLLLLGYAAVALFTFPQYGVNPDEPSHIAYGEAVVRWYTSFFQERAISQWTNTWPSPPG